MTQACSPQSKVFQNHLRWTRIEIGLDPKTFNIILDQLRYLLFCLNNLHSERN